MNRRTSRCSCVAEVLGHRQAGQADPLAGAGRLVHLAEHERGLGDDARLGHLVDEVVALAAALADAGEHGHAGVLLGDVPDQLLDDDRLADAGPAEDADLAALLERADQVDDLEPGLEDLDLGRLLVERRRVAVDRQADLGDDRALAVDRVAEDVEHATERRLADRDGDRRAGVADADAAGEPVGRGHRDRADPVVAEVLLDLADERLLALALDLDGVVDAGQLAGRELDVDDGPVIWMTRPVAAGAAVAMRLVPPASLASAGVRAGRDLDHLAGDVGLADLVVREGQVLDELFGVLGRVLHRDHPARLLAGLGLEHGLEQARRDVAREELLEHGRRRSARR